MEQEKKCENCKYFVAHYAKGKSFFKRISVGHCTRVNIYLRKVVLHNDCCDKWESNGGEKEAQKESLKEVIKSIRTSLNYIENILKDDLNTD